MKEKIHHIPVWDAMRSKSDCPICTLRASAEGGAARSILGGDVMMNVEFNIKLKRYTFCQKHMYSLHDCGDKLAFAIVLQKLVQQQRKSTDANLAALKKSGLCQTIRVFCENTIFNKKKQAQSKLDADETLAHFNAEAQSRIQQIGVSLPCLMCEQIDEMVQQYIETFVALCDKDKEFCGTYFDSCGMCQSHYYQTCESAHKQLWSSRARRNKVVDLLFAVQSRNLEKLDQDLLWFIKKFDYRYVNEPWKDSRDAVERAQRAVAASGEHSA